MPKIDMHQVRNISTSTNALEVAAELRNWARARNHHDLDATPLYKAAWIIEAFVTFGGVNITLVEGEWDSI